MTAAADAPAEVLTIPNTPAHVRNDPGATVGAFFDPVATALITVHLDMTKPTDPDVLAGYDKHIERRGRRLWMMQADRYLAELAEANEQHDSPTPNHNFRAAPTMRDRSRFTADGHLAATNDWPDQVYAVDPWQLPTEWHLHQWAYGTGLWRAQGIKRDRDLMAKDRARKDRTERRTSA